ncbi:MAG: DNRLRE domain-containing protein [Candidatus Coatesbacteria bacterium]|nr:MAG: DNRLRE domain-containing protein [Candidatus Coatesbacteria bacterium]
MLKIILCMMLIPVVCVGDTWLQPQAGEGLDAMISSVEPYENYGDEIAFDIGYYDKHRGLIKFEIENIGIYEDAVLYLTCEYAEIEADYGIHIITEDWSPGTVRWFNQPSFQSTPVATVTFGPVSDTTWMEANIVDALYYWQDTANYGVLIKQAGSYDAVGVFLPSEITPYKPGFEPKLHLCEGNAVSPVSLGALKAAFR